MIKKIIPMLALVSLNISASASSSSIELDNTQAAVHVLYRFDKTGKIEKEHIKDALLICRITPYGKTIVKQIKDMLFEIDFKCNEDDEVVADCDFIAMNKSDEVTITSGGSLLLKLSPQTREQIIDLDDEWYTQLHKEISADDAKRCWSAQEPRPSHEPQRSVSVGELEWRAKESTKSTEPKLSASVDDVKKYVFNLFND